MWTWLLEITGVKSWIAYAIAIFLASGVIATIVYSVWRNGVNSEKTKQMTDTLKRITEDAKRNARIERMSTSKRREQLRKRWTAK